jgi:pSer/pThr/pTyr-binding forkhead associated (FHA) protein
MDEKLVFQAGVQAGKEYIFSGEEVSIGRDPKNVIVVDDVQVSRQHLRIFQKDQELFVEDLKSTNGTFLNGKPLTKPQKLRNGDQVTMGQNSIFEVQTSGSISEEEEKHNVLPIFGKQAKPGSKRTEERIEYVEDLSEDLQGGKSKSSITGKYPTWAIVAMIVIGFIIIFCIVPSVVIETTNQWCNLFSGFFNARCLSLK